MEAVEGQLEEVRDSRVSLRMSVSVDENVNLAFAVVLDGSTIAGPGRVHHLGGWIVRGGRLEHCENRDELHLAGSPLNLRIRQVAGWWAPLQQSRDPRLEFWRDWSLATIQAVDHRLGQGIVRIK